MFLAESPVPTLPPSTHSLIMRRPKRGALSTNAILGRARGFGEICLVIDFQSRPQTGTATMVARLLIWVATLLGRMFQSLAVAVLR